MLLTAHRAKGLEFDHVVVLDGGWDRVGRGEDVDAPRRLYYVAMTRARKTLTLARLPGSHPFQDALLKAPSVLERDRPAACPPAAPELSRRYRRLSLRDVFLSFAGYRNHDHAVHGAVATLSPGDMLKARPGRLGGSCWTATGPSLVSLQGISKQSLECGARLLKSLLLWHGTASTQSRSTGNEFAAILGKWWCRSSCLSRIHRLNAPENEAACMNTFALYESLMGVRWRSLLAQLTAIQYDLLAELAVNVGRVVTVEDLLHRVWGPTNSGSPRVVRTQLIRLRRNWGRTAKKPPTPTSSPSPGWGTRWQRGKSRTGEG